MSLLPKTTSEFCQTEYWNSFFKQRGDRAFEWYGEYAELCGFLHKYIKAREKLLVVGCGNSKLSADLYDVGYKEITNVDISEIVIKKMRNLHAEQRPDLIFLEMDVLNMSFENESFSVVFDKGTLDALMPNDDEKSRDNAVKLFSEVDRILKVGGRYICISLLQYHILNTLLDQFVDRGWLIRICRCYEAEDKAIEDGIQKPLPVFIIICTKFRKLPKFEPVLELGLMKDGTISRMKNLDEVKRCIIEDQRIAMICNGLQTSTIEDIEVQLEIYDPAIDTPKYMITIVERPSVKLSSMKYSAFIVPQGRESEWLFGSPEGRQQLLDTTSCDRLAIITLGRGHKFTTLSHVQDELTDIIVNMAPASYKPPIQFLSVGGDLGIRKEIARGRSEFSGEYLVEECQNSVQEVFRRLYFLSNQNVIQSEAAMKKVKTRKGNKVVVDVSHLCCEHHTWMVLGLVCGGSEVAVVGLGGGSLCSYIRKAFPEIKITAVDLDPAMVNIATKHFGLVLDQKISVKIADGLIWLKEVLDKGTHFDAVLFDVDGKDITLGMSCPPISFVEPAVLKDVHQILNEKGIFILNLVCRDVSLRNDIWNRLTCVFSTVASLKLEEDLNEIIFCWKGEIKPKEELVGAVKKLNTIIKEKKMMELECLQPENVLKLLRLKV